MASAEPPKKKHKSHHGKSKYFSKHHRKLYLEVGQRGFFATCNFREKECIGEAYNVLREFAEDLYGEEDLKTHVGDVKSEAKTSDGCGDVSDDLQNDIGDAKRDAKIRCKPRFEVVDTGIVNCVFMRTTLPNPVELGAHIVKEVARTRAQKTRHLLRLVPVETVCRANTTDIVAAAGKLFDKHFVEQPTSFSVAFNRRYNNSVNRDEVIRELAQLVLSKNAGNRVDLNHGNKTVIVEIMKGLCCVAVVDDYLLNRKYNLVELANKGQLEATTETETEAVGKIKHTGNDDEAGNAKTNEAEKHEQETKNESGEDEHDDKDVENKNDGEDSDEE